MQLLGRRSRTEVHYASDARNADAFGGFAGATRAARGSALRRHRVGGRGREIPPAAGAADYLLRGNCVHCGDRGLDCSRRLDDVFPKHERGRQGAPDRSQRHRHFRHSRLSGNISPEPTRVRGRRRYTITYTSADGNVHEPPPIEHTEYNGASIVPFEEATYKANMDELQEFAKSRCPNSESGVYTQPCLFDGVGLRYARDAPELLELPRFPPHRTWWDTLRRDCAWQTLFAIIFGLADYVIILFVGLPLMAMIGVF